MTDSPIHVAFLWHMHQPLYKDPIDGGYLLPWVRLHGTKDYYDMVHVLERYPDIHQTFNIVPSLLEQIIDYTEGRAKDRFADIAVKPADALTLEDKRFLLDKFFFANWENMIMSFPRYWELLKKRGLHSQNGNFHDVIRFFTPQDFLDLQVLFNLVWIDPSLRNADDFFQTLINKGHYFTEDEKLKLIEKQHDILKMIIPEYRKMQDKGIIELSTSPYYHPIVPLLCDTESAKESMPWAVLPNSRFIHPEDAAEQIRRAISFHEIIFGRKPLGMWPSEGGVSEEAVSLMARYGINWIASDEMILEKSLDKHIRRGDTNICLEPHVLYKPYKMFKDAGEITVVFRDRILSDLIGFVYSKWDAEKAADDFVEKLMSIRQSLGSEIQNHLVTIVLDGENAWEYYKNDGNDFLNALYSKISGSLLIKCVTINEYLEKHTSAERLTGIFAGSWINHNFKVWIGHDEDNTAWDHLSKAREELVFFENNLKMNTKELRQEDILKLKQAWEEIYAAEGSDWFWWYGEEHSSMNDIEFDELFRKHLKKLYILIDKEPPSTLDIPIIKEESVYEPASRPSSFIKPLIDGEITNYFEWLSSGKIEGKWHGISMHTEQDTINIISSVNYGFNLDCLFFRFDFTGGFIPSDIRWGLAVNIFSDANYKVDVKINGLLVEWAGVFKKDKEDKWVNKAELKETAIKDVVEIAVPFNALEVKANDEFRFFITIIKEEIFLQRLPRRGYIIEHVPDADFELYNWQV